MPHKDPEKRLQKQREWRAANREARNAKRRERHASDPEAENARKRAWRKANRDKVREQQGRWRARHLDALNEYRRRWNRENRPGRSNTPEYQREWRRQNPDACERAWVKQEICRSVGLTGVQVPDELVEAKLAHLRLVRLAREVKRPASPAERAIKRKRYKFRDQLARKMGIDRRDVPAPLIEAKLADWWRRRAAAT
jgi:hypothetical protein